MRFLARSWTVTVDLVGDFEPPNITNCQEDTTLSTDLGKSTARLNWVPEVIDNIATENETTQGFVTFPTSGLTGSSDYPLGLNRVREGGAT